MLLTIQNLPNTVTFNDIKSLIYSKCGIDEVILDNLVPHDNRTKKVTIGLSGEEDAAIFMEKIDGAVMKGHRLRVVSKTKIPKMSLNTNHGPSQPGPSDSMQSFMPQGSASTLGPNFRSPLHRLPNQNVPTMVPPPMNFSTPNMFYPNQSAFYMMNQSTYPSPPSVPNIGYQTATAYGGSSNQGYAQSPWSDNNWNQQQQSESQNSPPKKEREVKWDNSNSKWENNHSNWDDSKSKWDNSNTKWGNSDSKWENSNSKRGNSNPQWDNNPAPAQDNRRVSRRDNSGGSTWDSHNDPRSNNSRDSKWQSTRDSNRDNTYRSNQRPGFSRDRDSPNRRYNRSYSPRPSGNDFGDHGRYASGDSSNQHQRDNEPQQNLYKSPPRQRSLDIRDRVQSPPRKRERNTRSGFVPDSSSAPNETDEPLSQRERQLGRQWRGQFIATKARSILEDSRFQYETSNPGKLLSALTSSIKKRININFPNDYSMRMNQIEKKYNKLYGFRGDWVALRDSLQKVGGRLLSKVDAGAENNEPCKMVKKNKTPKPPQHGAVFGNLKVDHRNEPPGPLDAAGPLQANIQQGLQQRGPQYGGTSQTAASTAMLANILHVALQQWGPQHGEPAQASTSHFANVQQGGHQQQRTQFPKLPQPLPSMLARKQKQKGQPGKQGNKNPGSTPLALIPGRIPQYPKGDKKLFKQNKHEMKTMLASDLSSPVFNRLKPAVRGAIEKEIDLMCKVIDKVAENPGNEETAKFSNRLLEELPEEMKRVLKVIVARRMIPILPMMIRVFASPPIKRVPLENFLKNFKVSALKKARQQPYFIANCQTVEDHDQLCLMKPVLVGASMVTFKPLHLVDMKNKSKTTTKQHREELTKVVTQNTEHQPIIDDVPNNDGDNVDQNDDQLEEYNDGDNVEKESADVVKEEDLCQEMKNIYEQINNSEINENEECQTYDNQEIKEENEVSNEEAYQAFKAVQVTDNEDFTNDVDIDNIMGNLSEETSNKNFAQDEAGDETQPNEENIDMVDVNEEDLEDW